MIEFFLFLGALLAMIVLSLVIIIVSEGKVMDWIDRFQEKTKVSDAVAGELFQGPATSFPEMSIMFVSIVFLGLNPVIGLASSIGSGVFQFLPVIGVPALFAHKPLRVDKYEVGRTVGFYCLLLGFVYWCVRDGILYGRELLAIVALWVMYIIWTIKVWPSQKISWFGIQTQKKEHHIDMYDDVTHPVVRWFKKIGDLVPGPTEWGGFLGFIPVGFIICLLLIGVSVYYLISVTEYIGTRLGIPLAFLSLTVLAAISSLPELATGIPLAKKGGGDQIIGNAVGSNSIDIAISFALMTILAGIIQGSITFTVDDVAAISGSIVMLIGVALGFLGLLWLVGRKLSRLHGRFLILVYCIYCVVSYFLFV